MVLISALARTLSILAFSTFRIFPRIGQDRLEIPVSGRLGRTAGGISLHDEDLAFRGIPTLAVGQLSVGIKGIFLLGQQVGLGLLLGFTDLGRFLRAAEDIFQGLQIPVKITNNLLVRSTLPVALAASWLSSFVLVWPSKPGCRMLDGDHSRHTVSDIRYR